MNSRELDAWRREEAERLTRAGGASYNYIAPEAIFREYRRLVVEDIHPEPESDRLKSDNLVGLAVWCVSIADHHADVLTPRQIEKLYAAGDALRELAPRNLEVREKGGDAITNEAWSRFTTWFFRECNQGTRRHLFAMFEIPTDEIHNHNHGHERHALKWVRNALAGGKITKEKGE